eukprot:5729592-Pleurochrysis_carterae.AAC.1
MPSDGLSDAGVATCSSSRACVFAPPQARRAPLRALPGRPRSRPFGLGLGRKALHVRLGVYAWFCGHFLVVQETAYSRPFIV